MFKGKFDSLVVAFRTFDKDKDGKVSREEMKQGLVNLKLPLSLAQVSRPSFLAPFLCLPFLC